MIDSDHTLHRFKGKCKWIASTWKKCDCEVSNDLHEIGDLYKCAICGDIKHARELRSLYGDFTETVR